MPPTTDVNTPHGVVRMSLEAAAAYNRLRDEAAGKNRERRARATAAFVRKVAAAVCIAFGVLLLLANWLDLVAGRSGGLQLILGFVWSAACIVCGVQTWRVRGPALTTQREGQ